MAIQKISDVEGQPIVGKYYLVPCVCESFWGWRPIVGPLHNDKEYIGLDREHWHYDIRFLTDKTVEELGYIHGAKTIELTMACVSGKNVHLEGPEWKRMRCQRQMPDFPLRDENGHLLGWHGLLEHAYKSVKLSSCLKCPHRGMPLGNLPQDEQGNVVCNGHGLRFNLRTGEMVSRL